LAFITSVYRKLLPGTRSQGKFLGEVWLVGCGHDREGPTHSQSVPPTVQIWHRSRQCGIRPAFVKLGQVVAPAERMATTSVDTAALIAANDMRLTRGRRANQILFASVAMRAPSGAAVC
jgi:hypothetical protein